MGKLAWLTISMALPLVAAAGNPDLTPKRQAELMHLLKHDCGSCHGMTLKGGLGPSLRPEALAERTAVALRQNILNGLPGTPMPPWRGQLTEAEAGWLVEVLLSGQAIEK
jgi:cytochrome c55X